MATPPSLQNLPDSLKTFKHYLKIAEDHDKKNKVVSYYCRFYVMQKAISSDIKPDSRAYLRLLMDFMEKFKKENQDEAIQNDVIGQACMEDYALKVFLYADNEDRAGRFNRAMIKSFFTAGLLYDVLSVFGPLSDDIADNQKYAKWKATYIHKCLQVGETPISGPIGEAGPSSAGPSSAAPIGFQDYNAPPTVESNLEPGNIESGAVAPPTTPLEPGTPAPSQKPSPHLAVPSNEWVPPANASGVNLSAAQFASAIKSCNFAVSSLRYEDTNTAIDYLQKALRLLTTGQE